MESITTAHGIELEEGTLRSTRASLGRGSHQSHFRITCLQPDRQGRLPAHASLCVHVVLLSWLLRSIANMSLPNGPPPPPLPNEAPRQAALSPPRLSPSVASGPPPVRLSNHYTRRLTSSPKSCFVCSRPSPIVLVSNSAAAEDFFYVCASHLTDRHFATLIQKDSAATGASGGVRLPEKVAQEDIDKVKREWEERQKAKKEKKEKEKVDGKDDKDSKDKKEDSQGWLSYLASSISSATAATSDKSASPSRSGSPAPAPSVAVPKGHEEYTLHRSFYAMRVDSYNKKTALRRAKELNFPSVPKQ